MYCSNKVSKQWVNLTMIIGLHYMVDRLLIPSSPIDCLFSVFDETKWNETKRNEADGTDETIKRNWRNETGFL